MVNWIDENVCVRHHFCTHAHSKPFVVYRDLKANNTESRGKIIIVNNDGVPRQMHIKHSGSSMNEMSTLFPYAICEKKKKKKKTTTKFNWNMVDGHELVSIHSIHQTSAVA